MAEEADQSFQSDVQPSTDIQNLVLYIKKTVLDLFQDEQNAPILENVLSAKNTQDLLKRFVTDPQVPSISVQRISSKGS